MRLEILERVSLILNNSNKFKHTYKNIVPIWTKVKKLPAVAVVNTHETTRRQDISSCRVKTDSVLDIYIYAKQTSSNSYDDVLSELITEVETLINGDVELQGMVVDCLVTGVKQDAGMLHPFAMAQLEVSISYLKKV